MPESIVDRLLRQQTWMDGVGDAVQAAVGACYGALGRPGRRLKDVLHGTRLLGHPLHPALTDMPLGLWTFGVVADLVAATSHRLPTGAGDLALLLGLVTGLGAAAAGYTDFHETYGLERRAGLLHGLTMTLVLLLDAVSLLLRWIGGGGLHPLAVVLALLGLLIATAGMFVGGHLTFGFGTMVNHNAFTEGPEEPVDVGAAADFPENSMRKVQAGGMAVLMVRLGGTLHAISAVCSHAGGPLDEGELAGDTVTCPWHGSRFGVRDGAVRRGPATFAQPSLEVCEEGGRVRVRLAHPAH